MHEEELIIRTIWTREKRWKYTEITDVYIYKNQGLSNPVVLLKDGKKIVKIVSAYSGYKAFKSVLKEKCNNKIYTLNYYKNKFYKILNEKPNMLGRMV